MSFDGDKGMTQHQEVVAGDRGILEDTGINSRLIYLNLWSCMGAANYGFSAAIIGSSLGQPNLFAYFAEGFAKGNESALISTIVGMFNIGGLIGCIATSIFGDRYGRKSTFWFGCLFTFLGTGLCVGAVNIPMLMMGRFFSGFGGWATLMSAIIYANEMAPATRRGELGGAVGPSVTVGYVVAAFVGLGFFYCHADINWRMAFLLQIFPTIFVIGGLFVAPESPRWLAFNGREEEALEVLKKVHYSPKDPTYIIAREEHFQICSQVALDKTLPSSWWSMCTTYWRRTLLAVVVTAANQSTGVQIITNYGPLIYSSLGLSAAMCLVVAALWLVVAFIVGTGSVFLLDRVGRRPLIIWSIAACGVLIAILATLIGVYTPTDNETGKRACVAFFFLFIIAYEFNEPVVFLYIGEIVPYHQRNKGVAIGLGIINVWSIWVTETQPIGVKNVGAKYYAIFPALCLVLTIAQWFLVIETSGTTLEEVAMLFGDADHVAVKAAEIHLDAQGNVTDDHHTEKRTVDA